MRRSFFDYSGLRLSYLEAGLDGAPKLFIAHANGYAEGRVIDFDAASYLARYADLQAAFGNDLVAATRHYISNGAAEGRQWRPQPQGRSGTTDGTSTASAPSSGR